MDRNQMNVVTFKDAAPPSPPARGAWIATSVGGAPTADYGVVASREGGVDRNTRVLRRRSRHSRQDGRLPRGGRGSQPVLCRGE